LGLVLAFTSTLSFIPAMLTRAGEPWLASAAVAADGIGSNDRGENRLMDQVDSSCV
jgi:hypothetical protein